MKYLRLLLFPFSLLYGLVVIIRNWLYDAGIFKSHKFTLPIISVGNLEVGGAGKSPMTEYLIRLFKDDLKLATLSRGYGRKTKGFLEVQERGARSGESGIGSLDVGVKSQKSEVGIQKSSEDALPTANSQLPTDSLPTANSQLPAANLAALIGDEPAQFSRKFPDIKVAVCEDRVIGIRKLMAGHDLILMDDAYQHRAVEPGLSILLFDYNRVNQPHLLLPAGNMREPFSGRWRAQIIVISKCPAVLSVKEQIALAKKISPLPYQQLFFTGIVYQGLIGLNGQPAHASIDTDTTIFLLTGIANADPLIAYLNGRTPHVIHHKYPDHHRFTLKNISKLAAEFNNCTAQKKMIVTTEKDAQRLDEAWFQNGLFSGKPPFVFTVPIKVEFLNEGDVRFNEIVMNYVREHTTHY